MADTLHRPDLADDNLLIDAIRHAAEVARKCGEPACALDHARLARWLDELYMRRTGNSSGVDLLHEAKLVVRP